jgi:hypothetical protein
MRTSSVQLVVQSSQVNQKMKKLHGDLVQFNGFAAILMLKLPSNSYMLLQLMQQKKKLAHTSPLSTSTPYD